MIYPRNSGFLFGAISRLPFIAGFVLIVRPTSWTVARNLAGEEFLVQQWPFGFLLHPIVSHGRFSTRVGEEVIKVMHHSLPAPQAERRTTIEDKLKVVARCGSSRATTYTPGPWKITGESSHGTYFKVRGTRLGGKWNICDCYYLPVCPGDQEDAHANARLIAAAPELLVALKDLLTLSENADETGYVDGEGWLPIDAIHAAARVAIAKALGT